MAQQHAHDENLTQRRSQSDEELGRAAWICATTHVTWRLADAQLAQVVGGTEDPGDPGDDTDVTGKATPILF